MNWIERFLEWIRNFTGITFLPRVGITDLLDIILVAFIFYEVMIYFRTTRAWTLIKGVGTLVVVALLASLLKMNVTSWLLQNTMVYGVLALVVIFQPEIRKALEHLGHGGVFNWFSNDSQGNGISAETVDEIIAAMEAMSSVKTGALICVEQEVALGEYEQTGIPVDGIVTSQLLINIFEKNTPLHDGAVVIRGNRVTSATCYLPLTDSLTISKEMGTRHRAALGLSEVSDAIVLVVSEETGAMSMARGGKITRKIDRSFIKRQFVTKQEGKKQENVVSVLKRMHNFLDNMEKSNESRLNNPQRKNNHNKKKHIDLKRNFHSGRKEKG